MNAFDFLDRPMQWLAAEALQAHMSPHLQEPPL